MAPEKLAQQLNEEALTALVAAAKIPDDVLGFRRGPMPRRTWFARTVFKTVEGWLASAHRPDVQEIADEIRALGRLLEEALTTLDPTAIARAADAYAGLTPEAQEEISHHGFIKCPRVEDIRQGSLIALPRLLGLLPLRPDPAGRGTPWGRGATYSGIGAGELRQRGRPADVRLEQLAMNLATAYWQTTGRRVGRGVRAPFDHFFHLLLSFLLGGDVTDRGDQLLRRVVRWQKSLPQHKNRRSRRR